MKKLFPLFLLLMAVFWSCQKPGSKLSNADLVAELDNQFTNFVEIIPEGNTVPRSYSEKEGLKMVPPRDWTSGFPAGSMWYLYELTGDEKWKEAATTNTVKLEELQYVTSTHDLGFMVFCSYGNAYRITKNEAYKNVIINASESLITRFNPTVGCIKSWDHGDWQFPVIVDNMMNLEMLFWASKVTGDPKFHDVAVSHADVTLKNHFREDASSYHVVSYDTITGQPLVKQTHQGYADDSSWARGQAWGLYGYTMCYRETNDEKYKDQAERIADYILANLPDDMVPYWDYNAPDIPDAPRDASAAAITASALYELSSYLPAKKEVYLDAANKMMNSLSSPDYRATPGTNKGFLLLHSVGHKPKESEVDVALNYADYYYLEALKRKIEIKK